MKTAAAILIAFAIGFLCRKSGVPIPAPASLLGVLLILSITLGYIAGK